jgi:hypothetical protein
MICCRPNEEIDRLHQTAWHRAIAFNLDDVCFFSDLLIALKNDGMKYF